MTHPPHRYADRAKSIKNTPKINESPKDALLRTMAEEIEKLRKELGGDGMAEDSSEEESSSEEEVTNWDGTVTRKKKVRKRGMKKRRMSASTMAAKKDAFEQEMKALQAQTEMAEEERHRREKAVAEKLAKIASAQAEREAMENKMAAMEGQVMVGGVNLLQKAEEQEKLLEEAAQELAVQMQAEEVLQSEIKAHEEEKINIEEQCVPRSTDLGVSPTPLPPPPSSSFSRGGGLYHPSVVLCQLRSPSLAPRHMPSLGSTFALTPPPPHTHTPPRLWRCGVPFTTCLDPGTRASKKRLPARQRR